MNLPNLNEKIVDRLQTEYDMKIKGNYLYGRCPSCKRREKLWAGLNNPWMIRCNSIDSCGYEATAKDLFPELYQDLSKQYRPTHENPHYTADIYLANVRGFDISKIRGWYEQGWFGHPDANKGSATVRFYLSEDKQRYWERLVDEVTLTIDGETETRKMHFKGNFRGLWWQPPGFEARQNAEVYLSEGILKAIALNINGFKAVSCMSSSTLPLDSIKQYLGQGIIWVLAPDNDNAGIKKLKDFAKTLRDLGETVTAALASENADKKEDWDDLHKQGKLTATHMQRYRHLGRIALALSKQQKAYEIWQLDEKKLTFTFEFGKETYTCKVDQKKFNEMPQPKEHNKDAQEKHRRDAFNAAATLKKVATFTAKFLYFQKTEAGDGQYYLRLSFPNGKKDVKMPFSHSAFTSASKFKEAALKEPSAQFTGSTAIVDDIYRTGNETPLREVTAIDYVGYNKDIGAYIYNSFAVEKGKVIKLNKDDFFQLEKTSVKTLFDGKQTLNTQPPVAFIDDYLTAFGTGGLIALAWWLGSLFAEQIRGQFASYPFLEIIGDAGSGKSQMVDILSKMIGKDADPFNPNFSTQVGKLRRLAGVANMPVIFNETDNENEDNKPHIKKFLWDEHKDLYEGIIGRATGHKSNDNNVREPRFKAALLVVQNIPVHASEAILSRFLHLQFDRSHHSYLGKQAVDKLIGLAIPDLSGFLLHTLRQENKILTTINHQYKDYGKQLRDHGELKTQRVIDNHAMLKALIDCLPLVINIPIEALASAQKKATLMAIEREQVLRRDHPIIEQFWLNYTYLNEKWLDSDPLKIPALNHTDKKGEIAINLEHCRAVFSNQKLEVPETKDLRKYLIASTAPKYIEKNVPVWSVIEKRTLRCWIFKS